MSSERNNRILLCGAECRSVFTPTAEDIRVIELAVTRNGDEVVTQQKPNTGNPVWDDDDSLDLCGDIRSALERLDGIPKTCFLVTGLGDYGHHKSLVAGIGYAGVAGIDDSGNATFELVVHGRLTYPLQDNMTNIKS